MFIRETKIKKVLEIKFMGNNITGEGKHDHVRKGLESSDMNVTSADKRNKYSDQLVMLRTAECQIEHLVICEQRNSLKIKSIVYNKFLGIMVRLWNEILCFK